MFLYNKGISHILCQKYCGVVQHHIPCYSIGARLSLFGSVEGAVGDTSLSD